MGKVATSTASPRPAKSICASPATSEAKRVQRAHWMQRSRSSSTRSEMAMGFSKWRFSSTKRRLARAVGQRLVLQRALAALVADRAVERVVGQQELEHAVLGLLHLLRGGVDDHALAGLDEAGRLQRGAPRALHLDQAHAAHADGLHARVVAEARDVGARRARPPR